MSKLCKFLFIHFRGINSEKKEKENKIDEETDRKYRAVHLFSNNFITFSLYFNDIHIYSLLFKTLISLLKRHCYHYFRSYQIILDRVITIVIVLPGSIFEAVFHEAALCKIGMTRDHESVTRLRIMYFFTR